MTSIENHATLDTMSTAALGLDFAVFGAINLWVGSLNSDTSGQQDLVSYIFHESRPDLGEVNVISQRVIVKVPGQGTDVFLPWSNYHRMGSLWFWQGWREGTNLCASTHPAQPVLRIALEAPPANLIGPSLTVASGEFDVFFISAGGQELGLARFLPPKRDTPGSGSVLWRWPLPQKPIAACAALGSAKLGSPRQIVLVMKETEGLSLLLLDLADGRQPQHPVKIQIPKYHAIPGAQPALRIDDEGTSHISLLVAADSAFQDLSVVDVSVPNGDAAASEPQVSHVRKLTQTPVAVGITFQARPDRPMRCDWAVLLPDGTIAHNHSQDSTMRPRGKPVTPLQMVAMSQATYILTIGDDGPMLETLR